MDVPRNQHKYLPAKKRTIFLQERRVIYLILPCLALLLNTYVFAQETKLEYKVKHGNSDIGSVLVTHRVNGNRQSIQLISNVKAGSLITFKIIEKAEAQFENGYLLFSAIYREVNGSEKVNSKHRAVNSGYIIETGNRKDSVCCFKISYDLLSMFIQEPVNITSVYSDNFREFIKIKNLGKEQYRLDFPNGVYQKYYYQNGLLVKQEIHNTLYTAIMELSK
ncbi:MAG TPA: hypothetical protein PKM63_15505 [Panacibacter sp.]|nr:hypothetical protein [Panacibacter sp.]HNP45697.1 hypothetical protein [Panacibacter sp.]